MPEKMEIVDKERGIELCSCGKEGRERWDNGLAVGVHCDTCYEQMITECRRRSW